MILEQDKGMNMSSRHRRTRFSLDSGFSVLHPSMRFMWQHWALDSTDSQNALIPTCQSPSKPGAHFSCRKTLCKLSRISKAFSPVQDDILTMSCSLFFRSVSFYIFSNIFCVVCIVEGTFAAFLIVVTRYMSKAAGGRTGCSDSQFEGGVSPSWQEVGQSCHQRYEKAGDIESVVTHIQGASFVPTESNLGNPSQTHSEVFSPSEFQIPPS